MKTEIKERPILFSGKMVRAILDGMKTQTRRVVKNQDCVEYDTDGRFIHLHDPKCQGGCDYDCWRPCPYGQPGDRLWVRETFWQAGEWYRAYPEDDDWSGWGGSRRVHYASSGNPPNEPNRHYPKGLQGGAFSAADPYLIWRKRPSIHMPRWASRLTLEITGVRVERLQEISEEGAIAEGISDIHDNDVGPVDVFAELWDDINEDRGYSWESNPWVWVVEFKKD